MRTPARSVMFLLIAALLISSAAPQALALAVTTTPETSGDAYGSDVLMALFPGMKDLYAPSWLREGLRVYYRTASGMLGKSESASVANLSDLDLYRPEQISVTPMLVRTDITGISGKKASSYSTMFYDIAFLPMEDSSSITPAAMGPFWIHPDLIKSKVPEKPGLKAEEISWRILSQEYQALKISYRPSDQPDVFYVWIVEKSTGLLLYSAKISRQKADKGIEVNAVELYSMRYMSIPWSAATAPQFVKPGFSLAYEGNIQTWNPKTGPGLSIPAMMQFKVQKVEIGLITGSISRIYSEKEAYEAAAYIGPSQIGGSFWLPQAVIAKLKEGQVIDKDPITNTALEVSYSGIAKDGSKRIGIFEFGKNFKRAWIYRSADGLLMYWMEDKVIDPITNMTQKSEWILK